ncbi:EF_hand domain-containing protein [Hexamita inflata]|uniref:EF hand domain-containing protein n=1 Tax=Hexamita inflata TaxID=28002 RepID=A0AA86PQ65_9EUKA|nr:EF hand domain-containing protein [Hexamita inflata]
MKATFTAETLKKYALIYKAIDKTNRGYIDTDQLMEALAALNVKIDRTTVHGIVQLVDEDMNNRMDMGEFVHFLHICQNADPKDVKTVLFYAADYDYTQTVNKSKLQKILVKLGIKMSEEELQGVIESTADNEDGSLSYEMFIALMDELVQK